MRSTPESDRPVHAGELLMVNLHGTALDSAQAAFLRQHRIRSVCLFRRNLGTEAEVRRLTTDLRELMGEHALIAIDQEGGSVNRATFLPQAPVAMALGAAGDSDLAEAVGAAVGRGLRGLGFNWNLAPVVDVNNNPANPVIAERSFADDPYEVARLAGAWMRGALRSGVACCAKHFPGHGDTHVDSHHALPVVDKSRAALEAMELLPFDLLRSRAPAIMTAHIVYPRLDPDHPATLSHKIIGDLLRATWGYEGVVLTDSLVMKAIHDRYGHARAAVLALQAGADMAMALGSTAEQLTALRSIEAAQADGRLSDGTLRRARDRLDALARAYPAGSVDVGGELQRSADERLMREAWARGLTGVRNPQVPSPTRPLRVVTQHSVPSDEVSEAGAPAEQIAALFAPRTDVEVIAVDRLAEFDPARLPNDGSALVLASNHRLRYPSALGAAWSAIRPDLHLVLWNPYQALDIVAPAVVTWGYADGALEALHEWLAGRGQLLGRAPVELG